MEEKINVAAILKDKPQGTKLYDLLYNIDVELDTISTTDTEIVVWCTNETDNNTTCHRGYSEFGTVRGGLDGLQILLPSKEMRNWGKFAWKKGDVLVSNDGKREVLFKTWVNDSYTKFVGLHCLINNDNEEVEYYNGTTAFNTNDFKGIEAEDVAQTYISTIEERLGGKLNRETLEVEKAQPEFKDGDIVHDVHGYNTYIIKEFTNKHIKIYAGLSKQYGAISHKIGISSIFHLRLATEEEKKQIFSALEKEGKRWDSEKKEVVDLKPKYEFKPMDLCLMKYIGKYNNRGWELCQYAYTEHRVSSSGERRDFYHAVGGEIYAECIPYKGNEHLLGAKKSK